MNSILKIVSLFVLLGLTSCLGGGSSGGPSVSTFGLEFCSLGCESGSFTTTQIATNQDIIFEFNDLVDPTTVNTTSISIVDRSTGGTPPGSFIVSGKTVTFRPAMYPCDTGLGYGFKEGSTYQVYLVTAPSANAVASVDGLLNHTSVLGSITSTGIADLVPGSPSVTVDTPDPGLGQRDFDIVLRFNDIMQACQLADPAAGESGTLSLSVVDESSGETWESQMGGSFVVDIDRETLTTQVTFSPATPFPGNKADSALGTPKRWLRLSIDDQVADAAGNTVTGGGTFVLDLPYLPTQSGSTSEGFFDASMEDVTASVAGLWAVPGLWLDSGLEPSSGVHQGGGHGALGELEASQSFSLDTETQDWFSEFLGETVTVAGGAFQFSKISIDPEGRLLAYGANPLRVFASGEVVVEGQIDLAGAGGQMNFGKYRPNTEQEDVEPNTKMVLENAKGGVPGTGQASGGSGGVGGHAWYYGPNGEGLGSSFYYDLGKLPWTDPNPQPNRFKDGMVGAEYCGSNGERVGGIAAAGAPMPQSAADNILSDLEAGSGMGSWAWPPTSNEVPDAAFNTNNPGVEIEAHHNGSSFDNHAIHRSRGGGGGGYWSQGSRGVYFTPGGLNPLNLPLDVPVIDAPNSVWEFNGDGAGSDRYTWDFAATVSSVNDAEGGQYSILTGTETLDPEVGLLLGGAGGGGAGMSEHGSWSDSPSAGSAIIDTYRSCDGGGGGAGGGALQLQAGRRLSLTGRIDLSGGDGGSSEFMDMPPYNDPLAISIGIPGDAGGGGGSGGALLLQAQETLELSTSDSILLEGGIGGTGSAGNHGGDGGMGLVRIELPNATFTTQDLENVIEPDGAFDLAPIGQAGVINVADPAISIGGAAGDLLSSDGLSFNGNASSVRSLWYTDFPAQVYIVTPLRWELDVAWSVDGVVEQTHSFTSDDYASLPIEQCLAPGQSPVWLGFQGAYAAPGFPVQEGDDAVNWTPWGIPGRYGENGLAELRSELIRAFRIHLCFDQDLVQATILNNPAAYYRVTGFRLFWEGD